ncbi:MAG: glycosyltransferase [Oscillochloris sp.]|nr:glycosyltransferase [Oscillochloris sp.]
MMPVSVIIPTHNEGENLVDTVECILDNTDYPAFELIVVDDGSSDGSCDTVARRFGRRAAVVRGQDLGVSGARNLGAHHAAGDLLIFIDAHCYVQADWMRLLVAPLEQPQIGMVGPAFADLRRGDMQAGYGAIWQNAMLDMGWLPRRSDTPYAVPLLIGGCQVVRRRDFARLGGYDSGMTRWGSEDLELSLRFWLMGFESVIQPQALVHHLFRDRQNYHVDQAAICYNRLRMAFMHFNPVRLARVVDALKPAYEFARIMIMLMQSDTMQRRNQFLEARCRDDDWFFARFHYDI